MHESKQCSRLHISYIFDSTSLLARCKMSLVEHYLAQTFNVANANKFQFHGEAIGLQPDGTVRIIMALFDPSTWYEVEDHIDIRSDAGIYPQLLNHLILQMDKLRPDVIPMQDLIS